MFEPIVEEVEKEDLVNKIKTKLAGTQDVIEDIVYCDKYMKYIANNVHCKQIQKQY